MNEQIAAQLVAAKYHKPLSIGSLGTFKGYRIFGIVDQDDPQKTADAPFYVAVSRTGNIREYYAPIMADGAYASSTFAAIEQAFGYYTALGLLD